MVGGWGGGKHFSHMGQMKDVYCILVHKPDGKL